MRLGVIVNVDTCMSLALRDQKRGVSMAHGRDRKERGS